MAQIITPGVPKMIQVTVLNGQQTGSAFHYMGTTPKCGSPSANLADGARPIATADDTTLTVTTDVPVSQDITYNVMVIV